ncbi:MAG: hypothetical protein ACI89T_002386 [Cognaticolwellia sp.]|jgi:hypothetical protein
MINNLKLSIRRIKLKLLRWSDLKLWSDYKPWPDFTNVGQNINIKGNMWTT